MFDPSDLRKGLKILIDGQPYVITEFEFCKPGKGTALYRCRVKNMISGASMERTYRPVDKLEKPDLEENEVHYSYADGEFLVFSDMETYDEIRINKEVLKEQIHFLIENAECKILFFNGKAIEVTIPVFVQKKIIDTEPGFRGDTANNLMKPAKIDNGYELQVPLFLNVGDVIKIDTRTGQYVERVSKA